MRGITVTLIEKREVGKDAFNKPICEDVYTDVENVLVAPNDNPGIPETNDLYKKRKSLILGIPKKDSHEWLDCEVIIKGERYKTKGYPAEGIEALVPTPWHRKVVVEKHG